MRRSRAGRQDGTPSTADALLFLGNGHHAVPALVVHDPVLEPVDKLIWMVIYQRGRGMGATAVFPGYTEIARLANVASTATVARAIAILRATRWLSLCVRGRDAGGRFSGNVYALHDEPLPLADALHLDPGYMAFLQAARRHHHARVRRIAAALCASLDADIRAGKDVLAPVNLIERRPRRDPCHPPRRRAPVLQFQRGGLVESRQYRCRARRRRPGPGPKFKGGGPGPKFKGGSLS